ncbi:MAG: NTP/NDP exchange transporter [Parachlamydiaceae bacterium]|nr:NTP/NDP exchange transporter [Parachlamydiaceae bacterium]
MTQTVKEFTGLRGVLFPIHLYEIKKFLPMGLMMFFMLFNYNILRDTKDTLVVNAAGAEALSLIKLIGTVPGAIIIMLIYSKLSNIFSRENLFYVTLMPFIIFFGLFAFVIYPNQDLLHPSTEWIENLTNNYPRFKTILSVYGSWSYAVFYVLSELWGSVVLSLLFWQFANEIVRMREAKRFYALFGMIANFGLIAAGLTVTYFSSIRSHVPVGVDPWGMTLNYLMGAVVLAGLTIISIYWWINRNVLTDKRYYDPAENVPKKKKVKMSLKDSFFYLIKSKHLGLIALIVICYGISINVVEAVWKDQIMRVYSNENDYNAFMGHFTTMTGIITIICMLIGSNIMRVFGWLVSAILTPLMILVTGLLFFGFVNLKDQLELFTLTFFAMTPTVLAVWLGFSQNILSKATKYSLFDPTKEMCYIPLDQESKIKGKAAVDVVGGRLGKSGGSFIQQFLLFFTGSTLVGISPYLAGILVVTIGIWFIATRGLNRSLNNLQNPVENVTKQPVTEILA